LTEQTSIISAPGLILSFILRITSLKAEIGIEGMIMSALLTSVNLELGRCLVICCSRKLPKRPWPIIAMFMG